jgi:hypothetical protein
MTIVCRFLFFFNLFPLCVFFSGAPDFYPVFGGYRVAKSLVSVWCYVGHNNHQKRGRSQMLGRGRPKPHLEQIIH